MKLHFDTLSCHITKPLLVDFEDSAFLRGEPNNDWTSLLLSILTIDPPGHGQNRWLVISSYDGVRPSEQVNDLLYHCVGWVTVTQTCSKLYIYKSGCIMKLTE